MIKVITLALIAPILIIFGMSRADENLRDTGKLTASPYFIIDKKINRLPVEKNGGTIDFYPARNWNVKDPGISAKSALVYDLSDGKAIFQKNVGEVLPIASLTKIMSAMVVIDNLSLNKEFLISGEAVAVEGDYGGLAVGEKLTVEDLLNFLLIPSSNDAAYSLAEAVGVEVIGDDKSSLEKVSFFVGLMNKKAAEIGMMDSKFFTPHGLDGNISSAFDILKLVKYSLKYPLIWDISRASEKIIFSVDKKYEHHLKSSNKLLGNNLKIIGGKTGYTPNAGGCMILQFLNNQNKKIVSIVLGSKDREGDTAALIKWSEEAYFW